MKTNSAVALMATSSIIMMIMLGAVTVAIFLDNRELRSDLRQHRTDLRSSQAVYQGAQDERDDARHLVEEQRLAMQRMEAELASLKASLTVNDPGAVADKRPKATLVRAYLGNQYLASGWLLPGSSEGATNYSSAEPMVLLDPLLKARMDLAMTNAAKQAAPEAVTVNYNNYPGQYPYYWNYWPRVWHTWGTNGHSRPPTPGRPPGQSQPQPDPLPITGPYRNNNLYRPSQPPFLSPPRSWMDSGRSAGGGFSGGVSRVNSGGFPASRVALPAR